MKNKKPPKRNIECLQGNAIVGVLCVRGGGGSYAAYKILYQNRLLKRCILYYLMLR